MTTIDRSIKKFLLEHIADGADVLDVGAGGGWATLLIARERPACVVRGADTDIQKVREVNRQLKKVRRSASSRCSACSAENLVAHFGRARYDVAVSVHALHHYDDPFAALQNVYRVLRPGGRALIAEFDPLYGEERDDCPRFSLDKICWLCEDAKFKIVRAGRKRPGILLVVAER